MVRRTKLILFQLHSENFIQNVTGDRINLVKL